MWYPALFLGDDIRARIRSGGKQLGKEGTSGQKSVSHATKSQNQRAVRGSKIVAEARKRARKRNVNNSLLGVRRSPCKEVKEKIHYSGLIQLL
ncbi:hypothetical protein ACET3Z_002662 [Daucus carota]